MANAAKSLTELLATGDTDGIVAVVNKPYLAPSNPVVAAADARVFLLILGPSGPAPAARPHVETMFRTAKGNQPRMFGLIGGIIGAIKQALNFAGSSDVTGGLGADSQAQTAVGLETQTGTSPDQDEVAELLDGLEVLARSKDLAAFAAVTSLQAVASRCFAEGIFEARPALLRIVSVSLMERFAGRDPNPLAKEMVTAVVGDIIQASRSGGDYGQAARRALKAIATARLLHHALLLMEDPEVVGMPLLELLQTVSDRLRTAVPADYPADFVIRVTLWITQGEARALTAHAILVQAAYGADVSARAYSAAYAGLARNMRGPDLGQGSAAEKLGEMIVAAMDGAFMELFVWEVLRAFPPDPRVVELVERLSRRPDPERWVAALDLACFQNMNVVALAEQMAATAEGSDKHTLQTSGEHRLLNDLVNVAEQSGQQVEMAPIVERLRVALS